MRGIERAQERRLGANWLKLWILLGLVSINSSSLSFYRRSVEHLKTLLDYFFFFIGNGGTR
jgi:hypothetical protein